MVYIIEIYVDGACRGNGQPGAVGAAAAVIKSRHGMGTPFGVLLPDYPPPTNQRAEIQAIILALEKAIDIYNGLDSSPDLDIRIRSDSRYAVSCMDSWIYKWRGNGWINAAGREVSNRDLIEEAYDLHNKLSQLGEVEYKWIPRERNQVADQHCNHLLDNAY